MNYIVSFIVSFRILILPVILDCVFLEKSIAHEYTLTEAIEEAQRNDPWLEGSRFRQKSLEALSVSASSLPDPSINIGVANLPVDSFDFNQEAMTQFKVGVNQMFPRGKTRALQEEKFDRLSLMQPLMRAERNAKVAVMVSHLWLEVYRTQKTITIIEKDRGLFEHLVGVAESSYTTALGKTRQQDLVRAQLELTSLDDRLTQLRQKRESQIALLGEWLVGNSYDIQIEASVNPDLALNNKNLVEETELAAKAQLLSEILAAHPLIKSFNQKLDAAETDVKLSEQNYKPQWGVNASYAYRDADPVGNTRADFFSAVVSFDLPLFTGNRQDKQVQAAIAEHESVKTERALALRQLRAGFEAAEAGYLRLKDRRDLFNQRLLKEMVDQAEASLNAYTNDTGDFAEVVRARIAELNARIDALNIEVDIQKMIAQLNYFFAADVAGENGHE